MIVAKIQSLVDHVRDNIRTRIYKTLEDPVTLKEYVTCEVYTSKGVVQRTPDKGQNIDKRL